jgi:DNA segregation ATPase FtsK/SpoIIIE-like protein
MAVRKPVPQGSSGARPEKPAGREAAEQPPVRRTRAKGTALIAAPASGSPRAERWRDAARVLVVAAGVAVASMVANRTAGGPAVLSALGWAAYLLPPVLVALGLDLLRRTTHAGPLLHMEEVSGIAALFAAGTVSLGALHHAGPAGNAVAYHLHAYLGIEGVPLVSIFLLALGAVLALHITAGQAWRGLGWLASGTGRLSLAGGRVALRAGSAIRRPEAGGAADAAPALPPRQRRRQSSALAAVVLEAEDADLVPPVEAEALMVPSPQPDEDEVAAAEASALVAEPAWVYPPMTLLDPATVEADSTPVDNALRTRVIEETLSAFNVRARVVGSHTGPSITQFDVQPERGTRVQRVTALQNDLALALAARSIRIQAPVPGHPVIGIEIPNAKTSVVTLREVLESDVCAKMRSPLKIALGKDVSGVPVMADLARMPHLLIAGATGSGKSVCLNSLISCLLFHNSPERVRLLMVDPKMVELSVFNDVPHLLAPVVTDVTKVTGTLKWALKEMHRRYKLFAKRGARNLARYNEMQADPKDVLPFIVLIIDELADLMMVSPEDVEDGICRLAQLARATGMHLVLATQRPSVDVITGLIKANFPARIAFAVSSQVDSRTILDQGGAEKLLGRGDMLYQPSDEGKPVRLQGTYLSDREIEDLVSFWKSHSSCPVEHIPAGELEPPPKEEEADTDDALLSDAVRVLREYRRASVSLLQRRLGIGYTRAARLLDVLQDRGVVGPSEDGRSRVVLEAGPADGPEEQQPDPGESGDDDESPPL